MYYSCVATVVLLRPKSIPFATQKDRSCNATVRVLILCYDFLPFFCLVYAVQIGIR